MYKLAEYISTVRPILVEEAIDTLDRAGRQLRLPTGSRKELN